LHLIELPEGNAVGRMLPHNLLQAGVGRGAIIMR